MNATPWQSPVARTPAIRRPMMALLIAALLIVSVLTLTPIRTLAADAPDFSGTWVLNNKKGENLGMVSAVKETVQIAQTPQQMTLDVTSSFMGKTTERKVTYDLTGAAVTNEGAMGDKAATVARWSDDELVTVWTGESAIAGTKTEKTETRALSVDGKTMSVTTVRGTKPAMVLVYDKQ